MDWAVLSRRGGETSTLPGSTTRAECRGLLWLRPGVPGGQGEGGTLFSRGGEGGGQDSAWAPCPTTSKADSITFWEDFLRSQTGPWPLQGGAPSNPHPRQLLGVLGDTPPALNCCCSSPHRPCPLTRSPEQLLPSPLSSPLTG